MVRLNGRTCADGLRALIRGFGDQRYLTSSRFAFTDVGSTDPVFVKFAKNRGQSVRRLARSLARLIFAETSLGDFDAAGPVLPVANHSDAEESTVQCGDEMV